MARARLGHEVRREAESQAAGEGRSGAHPQLAKPQSREASRTNEAEQHEDVPGPDRAERPVQWPVDEPERPAGEVHTWLDERLKAVWVSPRFTTTLELVPHEPQLVARLQVISGRDRPRRRRAARPKGLVPVPGTGPRREEACPEVEGDRERYNACAAASSSSKSGTSPAAS